MFPKQPLQPPAGVRAGRGCGMEARRVKRCSWGPRGCRQRRVLPARFLRVCMCVCVRAHAWLLPPGHSRPPGVPHPSWRVGEGDGHQRGDLGLTAPHAHGGAAPVRRDSKARVVFLYLVSYPSGFSYETPSSSWCLSKGILWFSHASFNRLSHVCERLGREKKALLRYWVPAGLQE